MRLRSLLGVLLLLVWVAPFAGAAEPAVQAADPLDTGSAHLYRYTTPMLDTLSAADSASVSISLPDLKPVNEADPTWRLILGYRMNDANDDTTAVDSIGVSIWHGFGSTDPLLYRSYASASTYLYRGVPKKFDLKLYPLAVMRQITFYVANADSDQAILDLDVILEKGP